MKKLLFSLVIIPISCFCSSGQPWWTGSLLSSNGKVREKGVSRVEPYLYVTETYGSYNENWELHTFGTPITSINPFIVFLTGLGHDLQINFATQAFYNQKGHKKYTGPGDSSIGLDYQLVKGTETIPYVLLGIAERLPTGSYHHLDPGLERIDATGAGSFRTALKLAVQKEHLIHNHYLRWRLNFFYTKSLPVRIRGSSVYGGSVGTNGTAYPGDSFNFIAALEYQITQEWVLSFDLTYTHSNRSTFSGNPGINPLTGAFAIVGRPSSEQITVAPAIEYNFNDDIGIIAGIWATVTGRNVAAFYSPAIAVNINY